MNKLKIPFVSIITLNYNGLRLLENFFDSVAIVNYPKKSLEVIMVDNNSKDNSVEFVENKYPWVKIIKNNKNLGFGAGNNVGIEQAKGEFIFLINNDTVLDKDCILESLFCYRRWSKKIKVGAVSSKLVLIDKYLVLNIDDACFHDYSVLGGISPVNKKVYIKKHFFTDKYHEIVYIPFSYENDSSGAISVTLKSFGKKICKLKIGGQLIFEESFVENNNTKTVDINLSSLKNKDSYINLIQNAGNFIFRDGSGRDRGAEIIGGKQYYEEDMGQYNKEEIVPAFCGAGVFVSKKTISRLGLFDDDYFMYYEDDDLSLRMKENNYEVVYCPKSLIRHIHAGSSGEWSPSFVFNAERGRLLFVGKHWPRYQALWEFIWYIIKDMGTSPLSHLFYGEIFQAVIKFKLRIKVITSVIGPFLTGLLNIKRMKKEQIKKFV